MTPEKFHASLSELYTSYNEVIKPLIADYEAREQKFPLPVFNEIRSLHDHIARCYRSSLTDDQITGEIKKAEGHLTRIILDCYKYLDISLYEKISRFEKETSGIDLTLINNGLFYPEYRRLNMLAISLIRKAKVNESQNKDTSFDYYQKGYNAYCSLEELIENNLQDIKWARIRVKARKIIIIILWIMAALLSGIVSTYATCVWSAILNMLKVN